MNQSKENEGKRAERNMLLAVMEKFGRAHNMLAKTPLRSDFYTPISQLLAQAKIELFQFYQSYYKSQPSIESGERGEVERLKGLIENIFKANEEMALDITEPRDNIEKNWQKFKATNNL